MTRRLAVALALFFLPLCAHAQDLTCAGSADRQIEGVDFRGNAHFSSGDLANAIVTSPSSWFRRVLGIPLGANRCLDTLELARDAVRLRIFYRQRGYYGAVTEARVIPQGTKDVSVHFQIAEGRPVRVDSLSVLGLGGVAPRVRTAVLHDLAPFAPARHPIFDKLRLQAAIDSALTRLRNSGYPHAQKPLPSYDVDYTTRRAAVQLTFLPGLRAHIGAVRIEIQPEPDDSVPAIPASTVRKLLSVHPGDLYRQRDLLRSQRDLYQLETYRRVDIGLSPADTSPTDTVLTVVARLGEGRMRSVRLGVGWATLDCLRTQGRYTDRDFLGGARRLDVTARLSHLALCPGNVRADPFSHGLDYYASASLRLPSLFGPRNIPSLTIYSERSSEYRTYIRTAPIGGAAEVTRDLQPRDLLPGMPLTLSYRIEYGRTNAQPAIFCQIFDRCNLADIARLQRNSSLHIISAVLSRDRTDNVLDPTRGSQLRVELRTGTTSVDTGAANRFNRAAIDAAVYRPLGSSVLAGRLELATVLDGWSFAGATRFVPPEERLYAGGPNSVRGYNQNLLGPLVYIVDSYTDTAVNGRQLYQASTTSRVLQYSPTGGNTLVVGNLEWRTPAPILSKLVQLATFVDAGLVWNRPKEQVGLRDLRWTPGVGVRVASPVGPLRVDVAYNRYPLSSGAAYYVGPDNVLRCVSPGNTFDQGVPAGGLECPSTFTPQQRNTFLSRLTFHFSIGQAF